MRKELLALLVDPVSKSPLRLVGAEWDGSGRIVSGMLVSKSDKRRRFPVIDGIPRFVVSKEKANSVFSFGVQWNTFNFDKYYYSWRTDIVERTFKDLSHFKGKHILDAGAGSGMQTKWMVEAGAASVIALELSHSVDGVMRQNLEGLTNVDVIQCSIDEIPLKDGAVRDLVLCVNVIQHTSSVERTARELWRITGDKGEFAFNSYTRTDETTLDRMRYVLYRGVRGSVSRLPLWGRLAYVHVMVALRFIPIVGVVVEKADLMRLGTVEPGPRYWRRLYGAAVLNTYDYFGAHTYQHHLSLDELRGVAGGLVPKAAPVNAKRYFVRPQPPGLLLRLMKSV